MEKKFTLSGKSIFVFAGVTRPSSEEFITQTELNKTEPDKQDQGKQEKLSEDNLKASKIPDFISRLKGFINIKGIDNKNEDDIFYSFTKGCCIKISSFKI